MGFNQEIKNKLASIISGHSVNIDDACWLEAILEQTFSLRAEVEQWKANHADMVRRNRLFIERLDMPVERVEAYKQLVKAESDNQRLREGIDHVLEFHDLEDWIKDALSEAIKEPPE